MNKLNNIFISCILTIAVVIITKWQAMAQYPPLGWAVAVDGVVGYSVCLDANGNVITTGYFSGTKDMDPSIGVFEISSHGGIDIFVQKLDADGNFLWAGAIGGPNADGVAIGSGPVPPHYIGGEVTSDGLGNIYVVGISGSDSADLDPGVGIDYRTTQGTRNGFVIKLASDGALLWANSWEGAPSFQINRASCDLQGNLYVSGDFMGSIDIDPSSNIETYVSATQTAYRSFIAKFDLNGNYLWGYFPVGSFGIRAHELDSLGNIVIAGGADSTVDFDASAAVNKLSALGEGDLYILKLSGEGIFDWVRGYGGSYLNGLYDLAIDDFDNIYVTARLRDPHCYSESFDVPFILDGRLMSILKLNSEGYPQWAKGIAGEIVQEVYGESNLVVDPCGNILVTGDFMGTFDFDPSDEVFEMVSGSQRDMYMWAVDSAGAFIWADKIVTGVTGGAVAGPDGKSYILSSQFGAVDVEPGSGETIIEESDSGAILIKLATCSLLPINVAQLDTFRVAVLPNPTDNVVKITAVGVSESIYVELYCITGRQIKHLNWNPLEPLEVSIDQEAGFYLLKLSTTSGKQQITRIVKY